jgi:hypothetical protein
VVLLTTTVILFDAFRCRTIAFTSGIAFWILSSRSSKETFSAPSRRDSRVNFSSLALQISGSQCEWDSWTSSLYIPRRAPILSDHIDNITITPIIWHALLLDHRSLVLRVIGKGLLQLADRVLQSLFGYAHPAVYHSWPSLIKLLSQISQISRISESMACLNEVVEIRH